MTTDQPITEKPLRQLTAQEFIDIITETDRERYAKFYQIESHDERIIIEDVEITEEITLTDEVVVKRPLIIKSGMFRESSSIRAGTFYYYFWILGGVFSKHFWIVNGKFHGVFRISGGTFSEYLWIADGVFKKDFKIERGTFDGGCWIAGSTFSESCRIEGGTFNGGAGFQGGTFNGSVGIAGGTFNAYSVIEGGTFCRVFKITGGTFNKGYAIANGTFGVGFNIQGGTFNEIFTIGGGTFKSYSGIEGGTFEEDFKIEGGTFGGDFRIEGGTFGKEFVITGGYMYTLKIRYINSPLRLRVSSDCQLNNLLLDTTLPKESLLRISGSLHRLIFKDVQNLSTVVLLGLSFRNQPYVPEGVTLLDDADRPESAQLQIVNSDLGKTTFIDCDLSGFGLDFRSSKITDVFVTGTKMPDRIITPEHSQQQLGYSQIKKIYENRGDRVEANRYYAREMDAYLATLTWRNDLWEKFNLGLNKFSTNHGQSWQRGLLTTLGVGGLFYAIYCWLLGFGPVWSTEGGAMGQFGEIMSYFPEFINPIHKTDYVAEELLGKSAHIITWLGVWKALAVFSSPILFINSFRHSVSTADQVVNKHFIPLR